MIAHGGTRGSRHSGVWHIILCIRRIKMSDKKEHILVTGGAGYIGSQTVRLLVEQGYTVTVIDDLSTGHKEAVPSEITIIEASIADTHLVEQALHGVDAVLHFAANIEAGESVFDPSRFWRNNLVGTISLLDAMKNVGVKQLVFYLH